MERRLDLCAGAIIVRAGQRADTLYVVRRGYVRLLTTPAGLAERVLAVCGLGSTFNEAAVCDGGPALTTAQAVTPDTCLDEVPAVLMSHLLTTHPHLAYNVAQRLTEQIRRLAALLDDRPSEWSVH